MKFKCDIGIISKKKYDKEKYFTYGDCFTIETEVNFREQRM